MQYFTITELCHSDVAISHGINNHPSPKIVDNLTVLVDNCLDKIREAYGEAIYVTSGYRCKELNEKVKGSPRSHHVKGLAADIKVEDNKALWDKIIELYEAGELQFTQLIWEYGDEESPSWIHISYVPENLKNQILYLR